ncbi:MAG: pyridoxamine 5'-phosphate oxidase family protein [Xenococcaceae cyanobacterium]
MSYTENNPNTKQLFHNQRSTVKRLPNRASYERELIYQILDEGFICYVSFVAEGQPFVIPTAYGRVEDKLYIHGSPASRMLRALQTGIEVCVCVTLVDGLVLARSAFHHSLNYRSVVIFGTATIVKEPEQKLAALKAFSDNIIPDRWQEVRPPNPQELNGTLVLSLPLTEASAKMRTGAPVDAEKDYELPIWAGVIPLNITPGKPISDPRLSPDIPIPASVRSYNMQTK